MKQKINDLELYSCKDDRGHKTRVMWTVLKTVLKGYLSALAQRTHGMFFKTLFSH